MKESNIRRILIIAASLILAALVAGTVHYYGLKTGNDKAGTGGAEKSQTSETALTPDEKATPAGELPLATLVFASDYQEEPGFPEPSETLAGLLRAVKEGGKDPDNVIFCGDYSNDDQLYDYQLSPDGAIQEIRGVIGTECPDIPQEDLIFVQGNHDALTGAISGSGLHEYDGYLVYVLNTQYDFPWKQGRDTAFRDRVTAASEAMKACFDELIEKGETRPVFIAGHVPLHFTARTSSRHGTGDNMYAGYIFDVVNEAAKSLDIIYMTGHEHSKGWACYLGGACMFRAAGETLLIPEPGDRTDWTDEFREETLNFTYMNAGFTGYYMNCAAEEYSSDPDSPYRAADETLTCSTAEIYADRIVITRYDGEGDHVLGAAGEADPYKGGIDEGLIGPEHYSRETPGPVTVSRSVRNGT